MNTPIQTLKYKGRTIEIYQDEEPINPRNDTDNDSLMICFHSDYDLGDKHDYEQRNYHSWEELKEQLIKDHNPACILPVYIYDHSGITISTKPFSCPWDSGQVGWILIDKKRLMNIFNKKRLTPNLIKLGDKLLQSCVETYDQYLKGEVYGYEIKDKNDDVQDNCWGFYGINDAIAGAKENIV